MPRGSAPGERRGGRQKGTPNKRKAAERAAIAASGELPLDYMLRVMRDPKVEHDRRDRMAGQAAPYLHARLQTTTVQGDASRPLVHEIRRTIVDPKAGHSDS